MTAAVAEEGNSGLSGTAATVLRGTAEYLFEQAGLSPLDLGSMSLDRLSLIIASLVRARERSPEGHYQALASLKIALDEHAMVSATDPLGTITYVNEAFCRSSGYSARELIGQNHRVVSSGVHSRVFFAELWSTITRGETWRGELCDRTRDGRLQWSSATIVPIPGRAGTPAEYVAVRHDITARKELEISLAAARAAAEDAERAKGELVATVSHELRTPLAGILGMIELALSRGLDPCAREEIELARSAAEGLLGLVNDLVDFSRVEARRLVFERVPFDPRAELVGVLRLLEHRADDKGIELAGSHAGLPSAVRGDPLRFRQVLVNLIGNAIKFTERGGVVVEISYRARGEGGEIECHVRDTGIGVPREKLAAIFEPFSQADASTSRRFGGSGLGLAITRRLVSLMGGEIGVQSEVGKGSDFYFRLPLPATGPREEASAPETAEGDPLEVLLVDDCVVNERIARSLLERQGHRVTVARDGARAVELARGGRFDVVLMDVHLPVLDGIAATRLIRAHEAEDARAPVPIVALTGSASAEDRASCLDAGMSDHLSKPFLARQLREKVAAWGARRALCRPDALAREDAGPR